MRILFLSQCLPFPPASGVRSRTFNVLKELQREFEVTLLPFFRRNHQPLPADRETARRGLQQVVPDVGVPVPIPNEASGARRLWDHLRSVLLGRAYTCYEYQSRAFRRQLHDTLERISPDLIHLDSVDLQGTIDDLPTGWRPVSCTHHDIEPLLLRLRAAHAGTLAGTYMRYQATLVERLMREVCPQFDLNVMMSALDAERLQEIAPGARTVVAPNGVDAEYFQPARGAGPRDREIVFLGPTYQFANRDAVEYLLAEIFPLLRAVDPRVTLTLVGANSPADRARFAAVPGVTCAGQVSDVRPYLSAASCSVVPIRVGGGTRLKILDAWAMGQAVVSTSVGCEGLEVGDGENILLRDEPRAFAEAVLTVMRDPELRARLGATGRATVERRYTWARVGEDLRSAYRSLAGRRLSRQKA